MSPAQVCSEIALFIKHVEFDQADIAAGYTDDLQALCMLWEARCCTEGDVTWQWIFLNISPILPMTFGPTSWETCSPCFPCPLHIPLSKCPLWFQPTTSLLCLCLCLSVSHKRFNALTWNLFTSPKYLSSLPKAWPSSYRGHFSYFLRPMQHEICRSSFKSTCPNPIHYIRKNRKLSWETCRRPAHELMAGQKLGTTYDTQNLPIQKPLLLLA